MIKKSVQSSFIFAAAILSIFLFEVPLHPVHADTLDGNSEAVTAQNVNVVTTEATDAQEAPKSEATEATDAQEVPKSEAVETTDIQEAPKSETTEATDVQGTLENEATDTFATLTDSKNQEVKALDVEVASDAEKAVSTAPFLVKSTLGNAILSKAQDAGNFTSSIIDTGAQTTSNILTSFDKPVGPAAKLGTDILNGVADATGAVANITQQATGIASGLADITEYIFRPFINLGKAGASIINSLQPTKETFGNILNTAILNTGTVVGTAFQGIGTGLGQLAKGVGDGLGSLVNPIVSGVGNGLSSIIKALNPLKIFG